MNALGIDGLHFLRPLWLLGLLSLPLLAWAWRARRQRQSAWREVVDPHLLPHLLEAGGSKRVFNGLWLGLSGLALAFVAMAGPSWRRVEQPLWQTRAPLVIALDLSSATLANDLPPSRLLQARAKIAALLKARQGGQVALVAYAEDAYTVAPLTDDVANIALFLDALDPEVMPEDGSRASRAIAWSQRLLRQAGFDRGDILLLSNEADGDARGSASQAARDGYRVSVLGLGSAEGAAYRKPDGSIGQTRLEADSLQAVAAAGEGAYVALRAGNGDLEALDVLDPAQAGARSARGEKGATWLDEGYWLLPALLLLAALAFRRGGMLAALLLCLWLPLQPVHAAEGTLWRRPDQQAYARMQQGQQAYRKGDFAAASSAFGDVDNADGAYNHGNALARQGRYEEAIAAYDRALKERPGMSDAVANRNAVMAAMKRKPPKGGDKDKPNPQDQQSGQSQSRPGDQGDPSEGQGDPDQRKQAQQRNQQGEQKNSGQPEERTQDPADQRAADAAQRQRMQKALQQQRQTDKGQDIKGKPDRAEQAAQRERSIANEAWLRRVPDDPGALLRAKFQLEYERRQARGED